MLLGLTEEKLKKQQNLFTSIAAITARTQVNAQRRLAAAQLTWGLGLRAWDWGSEPGTGGLEPGTQLGIRRYYVPKLGVYKESLWLS
ncbi:uncharacterized protein BDR25DRAFT_356475 [Lindgomyces ingoldianus]|uniref:Uncharacterized protein n=1 Tax=Lindgomyces ingoldianus TaxID=673940 RepID=A0ACB6QSF0_9PLEO|nr:uncharacterized protein BDR25DRAFT_356475 [Lindgomyces ingoldianus]KAF2469227.1 hypothetical protein BDR25DRAFT_356475 [Lindgomyces ingoldianus]